MASAPPRAFVTTKQSFGDCQPYVEFATPKEVRGNGQGRGNNGIGFMKSQYEIQVLDSWKNPTLFRRPGSRHLQAASAPGQRVSRPPGEWQTYDIVFEALASMATN